MIRLLNARQTFCQPLRKLARQNRHTKNIRNIWGDARQCALALAMLLTASLATAGEQDIPQLVGLWQGNDTHAERLIVTHQDGRQVAGIWTTAGAPGLAKVFVARGTVSADYLELTLYRLGSAAPTNGTKAQPESTGRDHACNTLSTGPASQAEGSGIVCIDDKRADAAQAAGALSLVLSDCTAQGVAEYRASAFGAGTRQSDKGRSAATPASEIATLSRTTTVGCN